MMGKMFHICFYGLFLMMVFHLPVGAQNLSSADKITPDTGKLAAPEKTDPVKEMTDIYDIKPPELFGVNPAWLTYTLIISGIILLLVLLFLGYRYWKKRQHPIESVIAQLSPEDKAHAHLRDIKALMKGNGKEFYFRLSAVFRGYIEDRYGIEALEMTSEELLPEIKRLPVDEQLKRDSRYFMTSSDPVKFTDMAADPDQMEAHYRFVRTFVEKTTPMPTVMEQASNDKADRG